MLRMLAVFLLIPGAAMPAFAQDADSDAAEAEQAQTEDEQRDAADPGDENYVDADDDDFRPSEDIPADQSIPFPTDI